MLAKLALLVPECEAGFDSFRFHDVMERLYETAWHEFCDRYVEMAKLRFRQKDYPGALTLLQRRIALDPNSDEAYYYMGLSYKEMKQYPEALAALRQAVTLAREGESIGAGRRWERPGVRPRSPARGKIGHILLHR